MRQAHKQLTGSESKGIANRSLASLIDDLSILPQANNETLLVGTFIDQPALRGLLDHLWNLNLTILSVESIPPSETGDSYDPNPDDPLRTHSPGSDGPCARLLTSGLFHMWGKLMKTQTLTPVSPAITEILKRIGLFLLILALGWLVFGVFSHYFPIFRGSTDMVGRIVTATALLAAALAARRSRRWSCYWLIPYAYFIAITAISVDYYLGLSKWLLPALGVIEESPAGWAIDKLESSILGIVVVLALTGLAGQKLEFALYPARQPAPGFAGGAGCLGIDDCLPDPGDRVVFQRLQPELGAHHSLDSLDLYHGALQCG